MRPEDLEALEGGADGDADDAPGSSASSSDGTEPSFMATKDKDREVTNPLVGAE